MSDRLEEIKNLLAHVKMSEHHYEADRLDQVKGVQALVWTIAKIEELQAMIETLQPKHHYMTKHGAALQEAVTDQGARIKELEQKLKETQHGRTD